MKASCWLFIFLILISCKKQEAVLFEFDPLDLVERDIPLSGIVDEITYIPLDDTIPIKINQYYNNPMFSNGLLYFADSENGLLVYNGEGDFVRKIGKKGRGPGEYQFAQNYAVDENTGTIYVRNLQNRINIYSFNGEFKGNLFLDRYTGSIDVFQVYNSNLFGSYNLQFDDFNECVWAFYDTLGNVLSQKEVLQPKFRSNYLSGGGHYYHGDKLYFWNHFLDTVYAISPDFSYSCSFVFKPGEYRFPKEYVVGIVPEFSKYMNVDQILETDNFIIIRYSYYQGKNGLVLVDKPSGDTYWMNWEIGSRGGIPNDYDGGEGFLPMGYYVENNREYLLGFAEPFNLKNIVGGDDFKSAVVKRPEKKRHLQELANSLEDTANPVLMIVRLEQ
jgi:hypothetical protein